MPTALLPHTHLMIRKLESNFTLTAEEKRALQELPVQTQDVKSNQDIVKMGDQPRQCCLLLEGFSCVYKLTLEGKRQIMALHIPGDMPDLQSLHLQVIDINIASLSPCKLGFIQHQDLSLLFERHPRLTAGFWHETLVDASIFREWLLNVGQREGYSRIAHIICELLLRLKAVGLVENENIFDMPITQAELADATGMTPVHVNRVLQALRNDGLIITNKRKVTIPDWQKLKEAGEFDSLYLHLDKKVIG
ncbi:MULTISPECIES: Crp/Fnr family transcriptional regulator [Halomonadaceae]|uniref:Crp/Fnr family transcriptional regulator n=2 Tax=Vreelandella TaxID=3137766 RepID=A0A7Z0LR59_9GAMM|nr:MULTISPECIES: Crp/Fnr family transcriptional regulator [Halomonas]AJY51502.1 transcriptional regulator, Crp/Fnr family [Halomonas sp. KO116]NYS77021.1 Crp/Fnr family transcriptional regulator [Halomonas glaciei]|tara:strand:+ start:837 stop:1583 length:747 start_codon:yes stop_codon:yes gene_type:complete